MNHRRQTPQNRVRVTGCDEYEAWGERARRERDDDRVVPRQKDIDEEDLDQTFPEFRRYFHDPRIPVARARNLGRVAEPVHSQFTSPSAAITLPPVDDGGQRHQDGFDIAAGGQPEFGAAIVKEIEFDITAPA